MRRLVIMAKSILPIIAVVSDILGVLHVLGFLM